MTPKQRVLAAFAGEATDVVPVHHIGFSSQLASALLGREAYVGGGIQQWREVTALWNGPQAHGEFLERSFQDAVDIARVCGNDLLRPSYWRFRSKPTKRLDENTFLFEHGEERHWRVLRYDPPSEQCAIFPYRPQEKLTSEDIERSLEAQERALEGYAPQEEHFAFDLRAQREYGQEYEIRAAAGGIGIPLQDTDVWLEAMLVRPDLVHRHLDLQLETARRQIPFLAELGLHCFLGGSDLASNEGPFFSPALFRRFLVEPLRKLVELCRGCGGYFSFASDGNLWPLADMLFEEAGVPAYHEIDGRAGMDLRTLHDRYPELVLIGNISSHTVHLGPPEAIVRETEAALEEAKRRGRTLVGVSNYFVPGTPLAHAELVLETIQAGRRISTRSHKETKNTKEV